MSITSPYIPVGDNIVLAKRNPRVSGGGILLPDSSMAAMTNELDVVAIGPAVPKDSIKLGNRVFLKPGADVFMFPPVKTELESTPKGVPVSSPADPILFFCAAYTSVAAIIK